MHVFGSGILALYVDPGSGAVLWQVVGATVFGALITFRTRLVSLFRKRD